MSLKQLAVAGTVGALTAAGAAAGTRWRRLEVQRAELNREFEKAMGELRALDEDGLRRAEALQAKRTRTWRMHETVDALWTDRLERYRQTNLDIHAYLLSLPEALGALKGLTNHYRYMSEEMRKFVGFDIACSKLHNLSLLLRHGRAVGFPRVAETVREMFAAEPLVTTVCDSVVQLDGIRYPRSIAETSAAFAFCLEELETAVEQAATRYGSDVAEPTGTKTPSVLSDGMHQVVRKSRLDTLSAGQRELAQKRAALDRLLARELRQLHCAEDVRAALDYAANLRAHFTAPSRTSFWSAKPERFLAAVQDDEGVRRAVEQLALWRSSAASYLMQRQAEEALECYQLLLEETLTRVNDLPR